MKQIHNFPRLQRFVQRIKMRNGILESRNSSLEGLEISFITSVYIWFTCAV